MWIDRGERAFYNAGSGGLCLWCVGLVIYGGFGVQVECVGNGYDLLEGTISMTMTVHYSSLSNEWSTPAELFARLDAEFGFTLDPCATPQNAKCKKFFTQADDGLRQSWAGERVFMNPPYGRQIGAWVRKAFEESQRGALVVCLIPARTDTSYWHEYCMNASEIRLLRGRVKFGGQAWGAPFPSAVVVFLPWPVSSNNGFHLTAAPVGSWATVKRVA